MELKMDCACRKPKPGLLLQAAEKYNLNLVECWMIGDSERDILAGHCAGVRTAFLHGQGTALQHGNYGQDETYTNLLEFVKKRGW